MKEYKNKVSTQTGILLPITLFIAFFVIEQLPEAPKGDTSFAWLPILLFIPVLVACIVLFILGLIKKNYI